MTGQQQLKLLLENIDLSNLQTVVDAVKNTSFHELVSSGIAGAYAGAVRTGVYSGEMLTQCAELGIRLGDDVLLTLEGDELVKKQILLQLESSTDDAAQQKLLSWLDEIASEYLPELEYTYIHSQNTDFAQMDTLPNPPRYMKGTHQEILSLILQKLTGANLSNDTYLFVGSLLKVEQVPLKTAALQYMMKMPNVSKCLPVLMEVVLSNHMPAGLAESLKDAQVSQFIHDTNVLMNLLSKYDAMYNEKLSTFGKLSSLSKGEFEKIADFIAMLSNIVGNDEDCRCLALENELLLSGLESVLKFHKRYLKFAIAEYAHEPTIPELISNRVTVSFVKLLRSLSRSVAALRTSLKKKSLVDLLLEILSIQVTEVESKAFYNAELDLKAVILGVLSNFVVDFSSLKVYIVERDIVTRVAEILHSTHNTEMTVNALWVMKHLVYNASTEEKTAVLSKIPLSLLLKFANDPSLQVQEQAFYVLRNITCNSKDHVNELILLFTDEHQQEHTYLFEYLLHKIHKLQPEQHYKMLESIVYIIVNISTINEAKRQLVINKTDLLTAIKFILSSNKFSNFKSLKTACIWLVINLIWSSVDVTMKNDLHDLPVLESAEDDPSDTENDNAAKERCKMLIELGFFHVIEQTSHDENLDLRERARTALFHMQSLLSEDT